VAKTKNPANQKGRKSSLMTGCSCARHWCSGDRRRELSAFHHQPRASTRGPREKCPKNAAAACAQSPEPGKILPVPPVLSFPERNLVSAAPCDESAGESSALIII